MSQILIRGLDDAVIERLKKRAKARHRSLESELRDILERASKQVDPISAAALADRVRHKLEGRTHSDSAALIREDRER
jgi:plasmid stability protein